MFDKDWRNATRFRELLNYIHAYLKNEIVVVKVNKKDVKIDSSWCVNIAEEGNYYVITPMSWNSSIEPGASVDFGIQGNGSIGSTVDITVQ